MSAILAVFNRNGAPVDPQEVAAMLATTPHHAQDGQACFYAGCIALAHQHFWITPEEVGEEQPLVDNNQNNQNNQGNQIAITCDARLDNREALITKLRLEPTFAQSLSDATLLLQAYRRWGVKCVEHLLGDFSFALWDSAKRHLFVARDALGARGLVYYLDREDCLIASQIKPLLAHPAVPRRLNEGKVADYLAGLWYNQEETFYQDLFYCPPGHCLLVSAEKVYQWRYWDINPDKSIRYRQKGEDAEHFLELLKEAVRCRLRTIGSVGISLSGGLDSTSIAALAAPLLAQQIGSDAGRDKLLSFSYVFDKLTSCDERLWIQPLVTRYGLESSYILADEKWTLCNHKEWPISPEFIMSDAYIWLPLSVMEAAQQAGCRVLLNGHFGDVLFAGAQFWAAELLAEFNWRSLLQIVKNHRASLNLRRDFLDNGLRQLIPSRLKEAYRLLRPIPFAHPGIHPNLVERTELQKRLRQQQGGKKFSALGQWVRYRGLTASAWSQGISAARELYHQYGLEPAMPFWDRRLIEYIMALPANQLGQPYRTKRLLREAMSDRLPELVRERVGKTSFDPLLKKGLFFKENAIVRSLLTDPQVVERRFIQAKWLQGELEKSQKSDNAYALWLTLSLELWLRQYWNS